MAKKEDSNAMMMKGIVIVGLLIAAFGGYILARAKYKPQIMELNKMITERDQALNAMKSDQNKIMMKDGTMWVVKDGEVNEMDADVMLSNGDKVTQAGNVVKKDGEEVMMKDGDSVDMEGKLMQKY